MAEFKVNIDLVSNRSFIKAIKYLDNKCNDLIEKYNKTIRENKLCYSPFIFII